MGVPLALPVYCISRISWSAEALAEPVAHFFNRLLNPDETTSCLASARFEGYNSLAKMSDL
jgi:hypothetical protein